MDDTRELVSAALEAARSRRAALARDVERMETQLREDPPDDEHDPDGGGGVGWEAAKARALRDRADASIDELRAALDRIERGTYGGCEDCGERIADARLEVRPAARRCIDCAR